MEEGNKAGSDQGRKLPFADIGEDRVAPYARAELEEQEDRFETTSRKTGKKTESRENENQTKNGKSWRC
jgi:hypothetical protein